MRLVKKVDLEVLRDIRMGKHRVSLADAVV